MKRFPFGKVMAAALLCGLCGCAGRPVTVNAISANEADLSRGRPISAEACGFQLLLFIPININDRLDRAHFQLRQQAGYDMIANLSIEESWTYGLVGTLYCTRLDAMAYPKLAGK